MHFLGSVEFGDQRQEFVFRHPGRQTMQLAIDADPFARPLLVAHIDFARGILADQHGGEGGHDARFGDEFRDAGPQFLLDLVGRRFPVEQSSGHGDQLFFFLAAFFLAGGELAALAEPFFAPKTVSQF